MTIPVNSRVINFFPFNDILSHSNVFITNGGYGGFQHAVGNGVPVICAGVTQDKPEVAMRVEWAGLGLNIRTN
jgi:UDP:flavonoid glycosyltransferase YjiC (YdhE family)